jgi:hypothetical protein
MPETSLPVIDALVEDALKKKTNSVTFVAVNNIWTIARYGDIEIGAEAMRLAEKSIIKNTEDALEAGMRVLLVGDSPLPASFWEQGTLPHSWVLPCVFIAKEFEGLRANAADWSGELSVESPPVSAFHGLPLSVLRFLQVPPPPSMPGAVLFPDGFERLAPKSL